MSTYSVLPVKGVHEDSYKYHVVMDAPPPVAVYDTEDEAKAHVAALHAGKTYRKPRKMKAKKKAARKHK